LVKQDSGGPVGSDLVLEGVTRNLEPLDPFTPPEWEVFTTTADGFVDYHGHLYLYEDVPDGSKLGPAQKARFSEGHFAPRTTSYTDFQTLIFADLRGNLVTTVDMSQPSVDLPSNAQIRKAIARSLGLFYAPRWYESEREFKFTVNEMHIVGVAPGGFNVCFGVNAQRGKFAEDYVGGAAFHHDGKWNSIAGLVDEGGGLKKHKRNWSYADKMQKCMTSNTGPFELFKPSWPPDTE
jgi:hypothetical protein